MLKKSATSARPSATRAAAGTSIMTPRRTADGGATRRVDDRVQPGPHGDDLLDRRDHRQHDPDLAPGGRVDERPELVVEEVGARQAQADAADAERRVRLGAIRLPRGGLVAADVERPEDDRPASHPSRGSGHRRCAARRWTAASGGRGRGARSGRGRCPIAPAAQRRLRLEHGADVRRDRHGHLAAGPRRCQRRPDAIGRFADVAGASSAARSASSGLDDQPTDRRVTPRRRAPRAPSAASTHAGAETQDEGDPQPAGDDRHVTGRGAAGERDPGDQLGPQRRHRRWIEVVGDDDGRPAVRVPQVRSRRSRDDPGDAPTDVADVGRARPEVLVVDGGQDGRLIVGAGEDRLDRRQAVVDRAHGGVDDAGVAREHRLRLEDRRRLITGPLRQLASERLELSGRRLERRR